MDGVHNKDAFIAELERYSKSSYPMCIKEWKEKKREYDCEDSYCICGKGIREEITIRNLLTGNELVVGNVCIKQFAKDVVSKKCCYCGENIRKPNNKLYGLCKECKRDRFVKFGKYKGHTLHQLVKEDLPYIRWLKQQSYDKTPWALPIFSYIERRDSNYWKDEAFELPEEE